MIKFSFQIIGLPTSSKIPLLFINLYFIQVYLSTTTTLRNNFELKIYLFFLHLSEAVLDNLVYRP